MRAIFYSILTIIPTLLTAQPFEQWAAHYNGPASAQDFGRSFQVDDQGNTYVIGSSEGIGTNMDIALIKNDALGAQVWQARYNGPDSLADWGYAIVLDALGNIYIAGETATLSNAVDLITLKYSSTGALLWASIYNGPANGNDVAVDIALDPSGNVFVTGKSTGVGTLDDYITIKYDASGNEMWAQRYNGPGNDVDEARTIHTDAAGNVYVSGGSIGLTSGYDFATIKYNNSGTPLWTARYNGPGNAYDLVFYQGALITDPDGNVYITGYSTGADSLYEYTLVKYDPAGNQLWVARKGGHRMGKDDFADAIALDDSLNVYITGAMYDSIADYNITTLKYNAAGTLQWQADYDGIDADWDEGYGILVDDTGNVYVGGRSNQANFSGADFVIIKYGNNGSEQWNVRYSRGGFSWPFKLRMDDENNLYLGGWSSTSSPATADYTIVKYGPTPIGIFESTTNGAFLEIWPNPNQGQLNYRYKIDSEGTLQLYNLQGQILRSQQLPAGIGSAYIATHNLPSGQYLIRLSTARSSVAHIVQVIH